MQGLGNVVTLAAHVIHGRTCTCLPASRPRARSSGASRSSRDTAIVSRAERERSGGDSAEPRRSLHGSRRRTWQGIAQRTGGTIKASTLAIMNDYDPSTASTTWRSDQGRRGGETLKSAIGDRWICEVLCRGFPLVMIPSPTYNGACAARACASSGGHWRLCSRAASAARPTSI